MPRFFIPEGSINGDIITISGDDAVHIGKSLRMKNGDEITLCREGIDYLCHIEKITADNVTCYIDKSEPISSEPKLQLTIYQALPKQDKPELIIQKTIELGASRIVFFLSKRCVSRPDSKSAEKKIERYRKIAIEAAKQSGRGIIPQVDGIYSFEEMLENIEQAEKKLICYENGGARLSEIDFSDVTSCAVIIGAEGGFEQSEVARAEEKGATPIWLGKRILRCETCPIAITGILMNICGEI